MPPGWKEAYTAWAQGGWNGLAASGRLGRAGAAARAQRRLHRDVEFGLDGVRHRAGADHGRDRGARPARHGRAEAEISREAHHRRMDGHDAAHRAAGGLGCRRAAHARRARRRRHLSHHRLEDLHHLWRARSDRQHHPFRARAPARCAAGHERHLAVPGAEVLRQRRRLDRRAQRCALPFGRAQARHSRLADLHDGVRRQRRRDRLAGRRGKPRAQLHVHDDEQCAPRGRPAGRRHRGARDAAGLCLCERAQAGPGGRATDRRRSSRIPTCGACC